MRKSMINKISQVLMTGAIVMATLTVGYIPSTAANTVTVIAEPVNDSEICSRADMIGFIWRLSGSPVVDSIATFEDVTPDIGCYEAVNWGVANGVTTGVSQTAFSPDASITTADALTMLYRFFGSPVDYPCIFDTPCYYTYPMYWGESRKLVSDADPDRICTYGDIKQILYGTPYEDSLVDSVMYKEQTIEIPDDEGICSDEMAGGCSSENTSENESFEGSLAVPEEFDDTVIAYAVKPGSEDEEIIVAYAVDPNTEDSDVFSIESESSSEEDIISLCCEEGSCAVPVGNGDTPEETDCILSTKY